MTKAAIVSEDDRRPDHGKFEVINVKHTAKWPPPERRAEGRRARPRATGRPQLDTIARPNSGFEIESR